MKPRLTVVLAALVVVAVACNSADTELSTDSTIITGGTNASATTTTPSEGEETPRRHPLRLLLSVRQ
jgi:hypothetical protein